MQPDLPGAGGAGDQQVRHAREVGPDRGARDVLAEPDRQRARGCGQVVEDVAERDEVRLEIRNLDAHRLLAGDRREDPDLGRRQRIGEVVFECCDLRDLRARRELQLVACDARSGDLAADRGLDSEVLQGLHQRGGGALRDVDGYLVGRRGPAQDRAVRQRVLLVLRELPHVEEARLVGVLGGDGLDQQRRRLAVSDHVREVVDDVDRGLGGP